MLLYLLLKRQRLLTYKILSIVVVLLVAGCADVRYDFTRKQQAAHYNVILGLTFLKDKKVNLAKKKLQLAYTQAPNDPLVLDSMAYFLEETGRKKLAGRYYERAVKSAPYSAEAKNNYGAYLCRINKFIKAYPLLRQAAQAPNYIHVAEAYENMGKCAVREGQGDKARHFFGLSLENKPNQPTVLLELVTLSYNEERYQEALQYLAEYQSLMPKDDGLVSYWNKQIEQSIRGENGNQAP